MAGSPCLPAILDVSDNKGAVVDFLGTFTACLHLKNRSGTVPRNGSRTVLSTVYIKTARSGSEENFQHVMRERPLLFIQDGGPSCSPLACFRSETTASRSAVVEEACSV